MSCECINWCWENPDLGKHHHPNCTGYDEETFVYLFYYEEAESCWIPAPCKVENIISASDQLENGERMEIDFKRVDMTDKEFDNLPVK